MTPTWAWHSVAKPSTRTAVEELLMEESNAAARDGWRLAIADSFGGTRIYFGATCGGQQ